MNTKMALNRFKKVVGMIAEIKIRLDRGNSLVNWLKNIILIVAGLIIILSLKNYIYITILGFVVGIILYMIGYIDLKYVRLMQKENELSTSKYNPHLNKISKRFK
jgi:hypothetical protein